MARAFAEIDSAAITANTQTLAARANGAEVCAVVKANGYGHGALASARAALAGGATRLGVAQVAEGRALRDAGLDVPIWLFSEPEPGQFQDCAHYQLQPPVYSERGIDALRTVGEDLEVHVLVDTGMHRVGVDPARAVAVAAEIASIPGATLGSVWTHLAVADEPGNPYTDQQLDTFDRVLASLESAGIEVPLTHAANSAGTIAVPRSHRDVVRPGVALYGMPPSAELDGMVPLRPAMKLWTRVSLVKPHRAGERISYGLRTTFAADTTVATLPIGYADGVRRGWWKAGSVLIHGQRCKIVGVVTMDQMMVDVTGLDVVAGDEAVLIGRQGDDEITATEWATALDTINYEITCAITPRVHRH